MNFGLRLDEILCDTLNGEGVYREYSGKVKAAGQVEAKQAITSLTKELVAEAKPSGWVDPKDTNDPEWQGYVSGINEFEQNLLKALETRE